ncbi:glucarate dehydratase [Tuanshanicoccus lijuaniae]|uniref:enolase C-terminal domain-like protein n=1 Tax=Aerococcaceae bacterium zg-1292 TaxID=2774330 RepID=UPI0019374ACC|nr:glucarate dehydratase [Aerococcaceae bacterium zg-1292]MBS4455713.1 glucarate dehydratase [Aerococcaceae bacterium zg-A91]MBS4457464.1 glucarate dehydratase [Aerococcaceae bacterium zg-BR33]QQA37092.1 glucarate dehydratase [Aerococcaceae bacterium zg-1292]
MAKAPKVVKMDVYPVAGHDSPLLTLSGCHAPYFTRNIVVLTDENGELGIGEIHGGEHITEQLNSYKQFVIGESVSEYRKVLTNIRRGRQKSNADDGEGLQQLNINNLKYVVQSEAAIECAMLDLLGKFLELPIAALLGEGGQQREEVEFLGYLFYVADSNKIDLPYEKGDGSKTWESLRRTEMMDAEGIVRQARAVKEKYGFTNFKLKGGVFSAEEEMKAVDALKEEFPDARVNIDPNGAWTLEEAIKFTQNRKNVLTYIEDPCGPEQGFSSREIMAEYKDATGIPVATNMIATNWRQFHHAVSLRAVDIVLADPHFWTLDGSVRMAYLLNEWGLTWGSHSNNHFDITLATFIQVAAAAPGNIAPVDTHWIWQDGETLLKDKIEFKNGKVKVPDKPGLGVEIDLEKVKAANNLYNEMQFKDRDDTIAMQYLVKDWEFNPNQPVFCHK